jgi:hypothetical protein
MKTTVSIDDDIFPAVKALADKQGKSLESALSDLARRGLKGNRNLNDPEREEIPVFSVRKDSPTFSLKDVKRDADE